MDYTTRLDETVQRVLGGFAGSLVGVDGINLASFSVDEEYDSSLMDAELASLIGVGTRLSAEMKVGGLEELILTTEEATVVSRMVGRSFFLCLLLRGAHQNLGLARVELTKLSKEFAKSLYSE